MRPMRKEFPYCFFVRQVGSSVGYNMLSAFCSSFLMTSRKPPPLRTCPLTWLAERRIRSFPFLALTGVDHPAPGMVLCHRARALTAPSGRRSQSKTHRRASDRLYKVTEMQHSFDAVCAIPRTEPDARRENPKGKTATTKSRGLTPKIVRKMLPLPVRLAVCSLPI